MLALRRLCLIFSLLALMLGMAPAGVLEAKPSCSGTVAAQDTCAVQSAPLQRPMPPAPCCADALAILAAAIALDPSGEALKAKAPEAPAPALAKALVETPWKPPRPLL